jgi:hypothetical protein
MSNTPLQTAASAPAVDPNTMLASTPDTATTGKPTIAQEQTSFADEWAKAPTANAPVRTWVDPAARSTDQGQYLSAWYDTPVNNAQDSGEPFNADANAAAIQSMTNAAQKKPEDLPEGWSDMPQTTDAAPGTLAYGLFQQAKAGGAKVYRGAGGPLGIIQMQPDPSAPAAPATTPVNDQLGNDGPGGGPN